MFLVKSEDEIKRGENVNVCFTGHNCVALCVSVLSVTSRTCVERTPPGVELVLCVGTGEQS